MGNRKKTFADRLEQVVKREDGCWEWQGSITGPGYGMVFMRDDGVFKGIPAHRYFYTHLVCDIPDGLVLDHQCHNRDLSCAGGASCLHRRCVNPEHLEPSTQRENVLRGRGVAAVNASKTHCKEGHELSEDNIYIVPTGGRTCLICRKAAQQRYYDSEHGGDKKREYARERMRELRKDPEYKLRKNAWERARYHRMKAEAA